MFLRLALVRLVFIRSTGQWVQLDFLLRGGGPAPLLLFPDVHGGIPGLLLLRPWAQGGGGPWGLPLLLPVQEFPSFLTRW